jgi:hypothetical protein
MVGALRFDRDRHGETWFDQVDALDLGEGAPPSRFLTGAWRRM